VAQHVVERLGDSALLAQVRAHGAWLGEALSGIASRRSSVRAVRGVGLMWGLDVLAPAGEVVARAREAGLLVCTAGDHTVRLLPPLTITHDELARGVALLEEAVGQ
jgi:acetylornithine/succinyldiaminopimelate/putrescine aminotransferase